MLKLASAAAFAAAVVIGLPAQAAYPERPLKLVVGYTPGSAADVAGREHLLARLDAIVALVGVETLEAAARHHRRLQLLHDVVLHGT